MNKSDFQQVQSRCTLLSVFNCTGIGEVGMRLEGGQEEIDGSMRQEPVSRERDGFCRFEIPRDRVCAGRSHIRASRVTTLTSRLKDHAILTLAFTSLLIVISGCESGSGADAYGNFEATEITVSAQAEGRLLSLSVREGEYLEAGQSVGVVDTTQLIAQRDNLLAQRRNMQAQHASSQAQTTTARSQVVEAQAQAEVWQAQLETARVEQARTSRLVSVQAATQRELNERTGNVRRLEAQVRQAEARIQSAIAQTESFQAQVRAFDARISAIDAQRRQLEERLADATINNAGQGTVLTVLARAGEVVRTGSPLYTIADLDPITFRAYVSGNQLPQIRLGMTLEVLVDDGEGGLESRAGTISFISPEAEFTPTPIQTRDERAELVYAFEIQAPNADGRFKIGMPGEVRFTHSEAD